MFRPGAGLVDVGHPAAASTTAIPAPQGNGPWSKAWLPDFNESQQHRIPLRRLSFFICEQQATYAPFHHNAYCCFEVLLERFWMDVRKLNPQAFIHKDRWSEARGMEMRNGEMVRSGLVGTSQNARQLPTPKKFRSSFLAHFMGRAGPNPNRGYEAPPIGWNVCRESAAASRPCFRRCCGASGADAPYDEIEIVYFGNMNMGAESAPRMQWICWRCDRFVHWTTWNLNIL